MFEQRNFIIRIIIVYTHNETKLTIFQRLKRGISEEERALSIKATFLVLEIYSRGGIQANGIPVAKLNYLWKGPSDSEALIPNRYIAPANPNWIVCHCPGRVPQGFSTPNALVLHWSSVSTYRLLHSPLTATQYIPSI